VDITSVAMDYDQWAMTAAVNVPATMIWALKLVAAEPNNELIRPFCATYANVQTIKTQGAIYTPFDFMKRVLGQGLTARDAYFYW
jgi:hypothetical protein